MYQVTRQAVNALGEVLPDLVLSVNQSGELKFASYFERTFTSYDFESPEQAIKGLNEYIKETNQLKLCEIDCDKYIIIREVYPMFHKTGYDIKLIK